MNRYEIRDILNAHKEHFRVLPTLAYNELMGVIQDVDKEEQDAIDAMIVKTEKELVKRIVRDPPVKKARKKPAKKKAAKKKAKGK